MAFHEIGDPKGICKNVAGLGRWGDGYVEVGVASLQDLPYIMGLALCGVR
jgi:predicted transport protein